jgi:hypothetical protein
LDVGKATAFVFQDEEWITKVLLGAAILLIPIFGTFAVMGYTIAIVRNVKGGNPRPLPDWDSLGDFFLDGLKLFVVNLVYQLPIWILSCPAFAVWFLMAFGSDNQDLLVGLGVFAGLVTTTLICLISLYALFLAVISPVLVIRYADTDAIAPCLHAREIVRNTFDNIGPVIVSQALIWAAGLITGALVSSVSAVFSVIPICGWILLVPVALLILPISVWIAAFTGHLYGQIASRMGSPVQLA